VAAICVLAVFLVDQLLGRPQAFGILCLALAGSLLGFLVYNFNPAKIFMGDSGSMFLGFSVAAVSIMGTWEQASNTFVILAIPVLLLGLPIFDTTFVTVVRTLSGRPVSHGGQDHTSHRMVRLGLSERRTVLVLYAVCAGLAAIAVASLWLGIFATGVLGILALIVLFVFGVFLAQGKIYRPAEGVSDGNGRPARDSRLNGALVGTLVMHKMRMAEVMIDLLLIGAAYIASNLIRFEGSIGGPIREAMIYSLPVVIAVKLLCFYGFGLYRQLWQFTGIHDMITVAKAVLTGSLVSVFILWVLTRLQGFSRAVFVLDGILLLLFAAGSRMLFRVFRETFQTATPGARRLMIYGAGAAGELLLREIRNNPGLGYHPVGFLDDDGSKLGRRIHGVKIYGGRERLERIVREATVDEIVLAIPSLDPESRRDLQELCQRTGVACRQMKRVSSTFLSADEMSSPRAARLENPRL
jgi:UDP-GlcNAc:undecaprenyl-phosphate GlcNAc-1-phosphate transferase